MSLPHKKSVTELLGLPDPPTTGRERLVAAAVELFYRHGFGAIGVDRVIEAAGVTKTTFYKHFESKDDLMVAAVQRRDEGESQAWGRAGHKMAGDEPGQQPPGQNGGGGNSVQQPGFPWWMFSQTPDVGSQPPQSAHQ